MIDLSLLVKQVDTLEQRVKDHITRDQTKDARIAELNELVARQKAIIDAANDPKLNELYASLLQRIDLASAQL